MAKILLVANPGDHAELAAALVRGDDALEGVELTREVGDDATLARFIELAPDVVVVAATLDDGDARALISAMRDAIRPSKVFIVLIGDDDGPIRTALDALGVGVERFVGRPLSDKALRFAVSAGLAIRAAAAAAPPPPPPTPPPLPPPPPIDLKARWAALADQLGDDEDTHDEPTATAAAGPAAPADVDLGAHEDPEDPEPDGADDLPALAAPVQPAPPPWRPGSTEVPDPPREPTLILSERAVAADALSLPDARAWAQPTPTGAGPGAWSSSTPAPIGDDLDDDHLADVAAGLDDDLSVDLGRAPSPPPEPPPPARCPGPCDRWRRRRTPGTPPARARRGRSSGTSSDRRPGGRSATPRTPCSGTRGRSRGTSRRSRTRAG